MSRPLDTSAPSRFEGGSGKQPYERWLDRAESLLDRTATKTALASLIILSVLPLAHVLNVTANVALDLVFLAIFGVEFIARIGIAQRSQGFSRTEIALLAIDALSLLTFVIVPVHLLLDPIQGLAADSAPRSEFWLIRMVRLVRLVVLVRFLNTTLGDLRKILSQRQIRYQLGFLLTSVLLLTFVGAAVLVTVGVPIADFDGDGRAAQGEGDVFQVVWWVFRQVESPDNLVSNAHSNVLVLVTSLVLTITGVFVMSFIIGIGTSVVGALMEASRHRRVHLRDHTVVVGGGRNLRTVLEDLVEMYGKNRRRVRVAVLDGPAAPPTYLEEREFRGVEYRSGEATTLEAHDLLSTSSARRVIVLNNDELGDSSDAYAVSSVLAARQQNPRCPIVVEMRHRRNIEAAHVAGGPNTKALPMGQFLGCVVSQNLMFPGIDVVFEELFTARGSEVYTHIYSPSDLEVLRSRERASLRFADLLLRTFRDSHATLFGVLLGDGAWTDDVGELTIWLNPLDEPSPEAVALGARKGLVPVATLRGLVALAPEYATLRRAAGRVAEAVAPDESEERHDQSQRARITAGLSPEMLELHRILVLGDNELLPAMVENTAEFVAGVEFVIVTPTAARRDQLAAEVHLRTDATPLEGDSLLTFPLPRGGRATLIGAQGDMLADALECPLVQGQPLDVVVLLADPREADPDANSGLMLLRFLEHLRGGRVVVGPRFRVIAEALSGPKGALLEQRLGHDGRVPVRVVPTRQMRSYFLVDSAYVPESDRVHLELLTPVNQDLCQLRLAAPGGDDPELSFVELIEALAVHDPPAICFAVTLGRGHRSPGLVLNPGPDHSEVRFRLSQAEAVYAIGETTRFTPVVKG